ncbi:MAG TPA: PQQ-binding-like beta-propeller repeat protein, partial [Polyangiaceae bacterium]|nr:PQQ-binding-like beta-propeller repeat protein [Polyangiaceae bacterium]
DKTFVALDLKTGRELWKAPLDVPTNAGIGIAPIAYDGLVYLSTAPVNSSSEYAGGVIGTLYALDQATGAIVWSFATVKDANLWGNPAINSGGGAWYPPTIDELRSVMYWGIGNPAPYPGTSDFPLGSSRPGPNLYTDSVVSLSLTRGDLHWYYQERPHDLFDLDFQNPPIPLTIRAHGRERSLVIGSGKTGTVVALDPDRGGKVVWRTSVGKHQNDTLDNFSDAGVEVYPGALGGLDTPLAYADGTLYAPVVDWASTYLPTQAEGLEQTATGELVAIAASDGSVRWKVDLTAPPFASVTVVNDVLFTATLDGVVHAFDRADGSELWHYQAPSSINAPITVVGDRVLIPAGLGAAPVLIALQLSDSSH